MVATNQETRPIILIFVDGLGWGRNNPEINPCLTYGGDLFCLSSDSGESGNDKYQLSNGAWARPIDAVLGVPGVPQSATGQTSLLTGVNAQSSLGKHLTGFPNQALRDILQEHSILKTLTERAYKAVFMNAFRPPFFDDPRPARLKLSATTVANLAAGLPFFRPEDLTAGRSLYQEFTNRHLQNIGINVPTRTPAEAGRILASQAHLYDFMLFEYFQTDKAGHAQDRTRIECELQKLDEFVSSMLDHLDRERVLVLLTSDHGNLEDISTKHHTTNNVPLLAWGRRAEDFVNDTCVLTDVTPNILARIVAE